MPRRRTPAQVLRDAMSRKGFTAIALSDQSGVDVTLIRRYLDGQVTVGIKNAPRLARSLGVEPASLLFGEAA